MVFKLWHITEEEYKTRMEKIKKKNASKERKRKLKEEDGKCKVKRKLPSTSKIVLFAVFLLCIEIIIFSEYAMIALADASAMYVLIGVPATLVPTIIAYYQKSRAENTKGGITYDMAMLEKDQDIINDEFEDTNSDGTQG